MHFPLPSPQKKVEMFVKRKACVKLVKLSVLAVAALNIYIFVINYSSHQNSASIEEENVESLKIDNDGKIDWHDYEFMAYEKSRRGPGENGSKVVLVDPLEIQENEKGYRRDGFYTVVSNKISSKRSLPDIRLGVCKSRKYLKNLPPTSIIVIFYDEPLSLLLRCLHSIYNRTPHELLHEIILMNDRSTDEELNKVIETYVQINFAGKVKYFMNSERKGLIVTRMEGARHAGGEVIVFLDSHMEVNVNWLPPLIEPIRLDWKTATVPIIDSFSPYTLEYQSLGHGSRGSFDWTLTYQWLLLTKEYQKQPGDNYQLSAMTGGAYAIARENFFALGGYDEGMMVWNGENYELSFKLHLCGGDLIQVPCSHIAHTTKHRSQYREENYHVDFSARNLKRVAEVWMDEYKQALYNTDPKRYALDPGNLTKALELKKTLKCKPFKFFLEVIAPDLIDMFPPFKLTDFAFGAIVSEKNSSLCVTFVGPTLNHPLQLRDCSRNLTFPSDNQNFALTWNRDIVYLLMKDKSCIDSNAVEMFPCHRNFGNQLWKYDLTTRQLINPPKNICITSHDARLLMSTCNPDDINQKFNWGYKNTTALEHWDTMGRKIRYLGVK